MKTILRGIKGLPFYCIFGTFNMFIAGTFENKL